MTTPRVRIWVMHPQTDDYVRLTLTPGQRLSAAGGYRHDEGYHRWHQAWTWDTEDEVIRFDHFAKGRDCDGPYSEGHTYVCPVSLNTYSTPWPIPRARQCCWSNEVMDTVVSWTRVEAWQRDMSAEKMGY